MKSYLSLIPISSRVRKRQNRMTILCIALAVFLVTSVFSMADMAIRMERESAITTYGHWHILLRGISEETASEIIEEPNVAAASYYDAINYKINEDYYLNGKKAAICGVEETYFSDIMTGMPLEGNYPSGADEVLLTDYAKKVLDFSIGDFVTLQTPDGYLSYRISGFVKENSSMQYDAAVVLMDKTLFRQTFGDTGTDTEYYVRFKERWNLRKAIETLKETYHLSDEQVGENAALLGAMGYGDSSYILGLYGVAVFLFVLILTAGVFMIAGSMNSNVAGRTQFFGMMRCIGASKAQIIRFVRLEALNWCKIGIPLGVLVGIIASWILCMALRFGIGGEFAAMPLLGVSPIGILCGIAVGIVTVLFAAHSPAKRAAAVSPVTAATGNAYTQSKRKETQGAAGFLFRHFRIDTALGMEHAVSAKKNLVLMTGSFALSIIMFLSFSVLPIWVGHALSPLSPYTPDVYISSGSGSNSLSRELVSELEKQVGVKKVFGRMSSLALPVSSEKTDFIDLISYDEHQIGWAKDDILEGDIERVDGDSGYVMTVYQEDGGLSVGDTMEVNDEILTVACVLSDSPFQVDETPTVICSEETFMRVTGENAYRVIDIQLENTATDENVNTLRILAGEDNAFSDRRETNREVRGTYLAFSLVVYGFLALIGLITAFYIVNSISMSVSARLRQYGSMRAIGMNGRQLTKMIAAESLTYAGLGCFVGMLLGLPLNKILYEIMVTSYFQTAWKFPVSFIGMILLLALLSVVAAVYAPAKRIRNMPITATINEL